MLPGQATGAADVYAAQPRGRVEGLRYPERLIGDVVSDWAEVLRRCGVIRAAVHIRAGRQLQGALNLAFGALQPQGVASGDGIDRRHGLLLFVLFLASRHSPRVRHCLQLPDTPVPLEDDAIGCRPKRGKKRRLARSPRPVVEILPDRIHRRDRQKRLAVKIGPLPAIALLESGCEELQVLHDFLRVGVHPFVHAKLHPGTAGTISLPSHPVEPGLVRTKTNNVPEIGMVADLEAIDRQPGVVVINDPTDRKQPTRAKVGLERGQPSSARRPSWRPSGPRESARSLP